MSAPTRPTPVQRLMAAMDRYARAQGEARWTNGYRCGKGALLSTADESRLYAKEQEQGEAAERAAAAFRRLAQRVLREASR